MTFQLRNFSATPGNILDDGEQNIADDGIVPRCECAQVGVADELERAREQRMQWGVTVGLGEGGENHFSLLFKK